MRSPDPRAIPIARSGRAQAEREPARSGPTRKNPPPSALRCRRPRLPFHRQIVIALPAIDRGRYAPAQGEDRDDSNADDPEVKLADPVPDPTLQAQLVGKDAQHLDSADAERDEHGHQRDVEVVVEL